VPSVRVVKRNGEEPVLDIGCGYGWLSKLFDQYVGVDLDVNKVGMARKFGHKEFIVASIDYLPFQENTFKTAILYDVLEHLKNPSLAFEEVRRVSVKTIVAHVDFESWYRFFTHSRDHLWLPRPKIVTGILKKMYDRVLYIKTSGLFTTPKWLNDILAKRFPNEIVYIAFRSKLDSKVSEYEYQRVAEKLE